ncbi:hypothetical protein SAMN05216377_12342 [Pseudonocardia oroxyli]|uniref:Uncharacterized protein n=2 Tax=Pseudonocardia oroxyli TaxID=366584 RepID=A0A1G8CTS9_PSEOR|nr:hypothetical protein SAMN05216377_12342 [Pseudonocardia oroxyli]
MLPDSPIARPLPYWLGPWCTDIVNGTVDARRGLPLPDGVGATPHVDVLGRAFTDRAERERIRLTRATARPARRRVACLARIEVLTAQLDELRAGLAELGAEPSADDLAARRIGEVDAADALVHARRRREHRADRARMRCAVSDVERALGEERLALATAEQQLCARHELAAARVHRLHAHTLRRISTYERRLLRKHPAAELLTRRWSHERPVVPAWTLPSV